jgi:uncharacterized membrane protein
MTFSKRWPNSAVWLIPLAYASAAIVAGLIFPIIENRFLPHLVTELTVATATAIYTAIASGMIALTGIVFSLTFVMVQFSATAYSPRLVLWIARDRVISHALGLFTATFLYAVAALAGVDRNGSGRVPFISAWSVVILLMASVAMFVALIHRIGLLQISRILIFTGDQGRKAIRTLYQKARSSPGAKPSGQLRGLPKLQVVLHRGPPRTLQAIDAWGLVELAKAADAVIEIEAAIGDTLMDGMPVLRVLGAPRAIEERRLRGRITLGAQRTFQQDPKYAIRILVDIAIRALSPAINDPTTAVQALDQIEDLLLMLGRCANLDIGVFRGPEGEVRLVVPVPVWEDFLCLAFDEIRFYGAASIQVMRRMNALIADLISLLPEERNAALRRWEARLQATIERSFTNAEEKTEASMEDRQGLGIPHRSRSMLR